MTKQSTSLTVARPMVLVDWLTTDPFRADQVAVDEAAIYHVSVGLPVVNLEGLVGWPLWSGRNSGSASG